MKFIETKLRGAYVIETEPYRDHRGFFARTFCARELGERGLKTDIAQINVGFNVRAGILRGMHFQIAPYAEVKIMTCTAGAVYDVIVDLRPESPTYTQWVGVELSAKNGRSLYVPEGFAHAYQTLTDNAEIQYMTTQPFAPKHAKGVRYNDPAFGIQWPLPVSMISDADAGWPDFVRQ